MNKLNNLLTRLQDVKGSGEQYTAKCPAHDDQRASLSIAFKDGKILLKCFTGCDTSAIIKILGLEFKDLFEDQRGYQPKTKKAMETVYEYTDENGVVIYCKKRFDQLDGSKFFGFYKPDGTKGIGRTLHVPYKLHKFATAETIYFAEGEKCVHAIEKAGYTATTLDAGAQSPWRKNYTPYFEGKKVIILPDNDSAGMKYAVNIKKALPHAVIKVLPDLLDKGDVYDWLEQGLTMQEIDELPDFEPGPPEPEILIEDLPDFIEINPFETSEARHRYGWNDIGTSNFFADAYKNICRYCPEAKNWYIYDGRIWRIDMGGSVVSQLGKAFTFYMLDCKKYLHDEQQENWIQYVANRIKKKNRDIMISDALSVYPIYKKEFDSDNDLFNCQNGTLNLKTLEFKNHDPNDILTKISNVHYEPSAKSPLFDTFINEVMQGDAEKVEYLQKALGYALTADTHYETCFILYGATTRNGKSTLMSTIMHVLGEHGGYSLDMKPETLALKKNADSRQASGDLARLDGCRFLNASEPPKRMIFDVALLKNMLGRDPITARNIYEREFTFRPKFKLFINTNFLPLITDETLFKSGRINVVTFERHFTPQEQDKTLKDKLISPENISGIFNWCLEGLRKFRHNGLEPPQSVNDATAEYQHNSDKVGNFISECLEKSFDDNSKASDAYNIYKKWCDLNGYGCENKANFFDELKTKNLLSQTGTVDGKTCKNVIRGYKIINDLNDEPPMPDPPP